MPSNLIEFFGLAWMVLDGLGLIPIIALIVLARVAIALAFRPRSSRSPSGRGRR